MCILFDVLDKHTFHSINGSQSALSRSQNDLKLTFITLRNRIECIGKTQIQLIDLGRQHIDPQTILINRIRYFFTIEIER